MAKVHISNLAFGKNQSIAECLTHKYAAYLMVRLCFQAGVRNQLHATN